MNITQNSEKITVILYSFALISILKQMTCTLVFSVIPIYKTCSNASEYLFQRFPSFFEQQMNMIRHQAPSIEIKSTLSLIVFQ